MDKETARKHNTPEYWDMIYTNETENQESLRADNDRWNLILKYIQDGSKVLDYGCGPGEFLKYAKEIKNIEAYAYDISSVALNIIEETDKDIKVIRDYTPFDAFSFDVISLQHILEHIEKPYEFLDRMLTLIKPEGKLIIAIPIEDLEWKEHFKVWTIKDMINLLNKFNCVYKIIMHQRKTQEKTEEGIFIVWRRGDALL